MLDWILNPYGVSAGAYAILWIGLGVIVVGAVVATIVKMVRHKDGS